ncbi:hypothetical protein [Halarcobacter sp.]|uniref:hypothetical protein n=1 Tax=Halarcobacter sp. TaxID=2321133 RepID=UPI002AA639E7|nr:hypothetical protein [Halarcobacter sp.]
MEEIYQSNFFDLFEFTVEDTFATRVNLQVDNEFYPKGFTFKKEQKCGGWDLYKNINNVALNKYYPKEGYRKLLFFSPSISSNKPLPNLQSEVKLYRFSKLKYLQYSLLKGTFLLRPSIYYLKEEHNQARLDNEHIHENFIGNTKVEGITETGWHNIADLTITEIDSNLNQYILCFSYSYDTRLYNEFKGSDACLVISNTDEFYRRVSKELKDYLCIPKRVSYSNKMDTHGLMFTKNIKYFIQKEYRYLWTNFKNPILCDSLYLSESNYSEIEKKIPKDIEINIGSIEDIAYILDKNGERINFKS